jgi:hypothetical protein
MNIEQLFHIGAIIKGTTIMSGIAFLSASVGSTTDSVIGEGSHITLGNALAVGGVVVVGAWYLSSRLQKLSDEIKDLKRSMANLPCDDCNNHNGRKR